MKKAAIVSLILLAAILTSNVVSAVPRLQTYIVNSTYYNRYRTDFRTWITHDRSFQLKVVGYWGAADALKSFGPGSMDCYLALSIPRFQSGQVWINGNEITSFSNYWNATPPGIKPKWWYHLDSPALFGKWNFSSIGSIDNNQPGAWHYNHGNISSPGWGNEISLDIVVRGYKWAHFDAYGIDECGKTYISPPCHDASFHSRGGGCNAVPEPGTLSLLGLGLIGLSPLLKRKKK